MKHALTAILASLAVLAAVSAEGGPQSRPAGRGGGPTVVHIAMGLLDIDKVDSADQSFTANLIIIATWNDPRLAGKGERVVPLSEIWHPRIQFANQQKLWRTMPEEATIRGDGAVEYVQRVWGDFSQPLDLHRFPFDKQTFEVRLAATGYSPERVVFKRDPGIPSGLAKDFSLPDWKITGWSFDASPFAPFSPKRKTASAAIAVTAERLSSHYVLKIILPLILIMAMSWIVFWIDPIEQGTQVGVATTSMLTLIAYRFMIGGKLPPVPYLTRMDVFILGSTVLVFLTLIQSVAASTIAKKGALDTARKIDKVCRIAFPLAFAAVAFIAFATDIA